MTNMLFYGDNLDILRHKVRDETIDLCYIDPPFNSKRNYFQIYNNVGKDDAAQAQAFIDTWTWNELAIAGYGEIITNHEGRYTRQTIELLKGLKAVLGEGALLGYLVSMAQRVNEIQRVLKPTGSFYLHCDPTASHYLKLVLDSIFCARGGDYLNEIAWLRTTPKGHAYRRYPTAQDILLFYAKGKEPVWNSCYAGHRLEYIDSHYKNIEAETGRRYMLDNLLNPNKDRPNLTYEFPPDSGNIRVWRWTKERMMKAWEEGIVIIPKPGGTPRLKRYLDEMKGTPVTSVWTDIALIYQLWNFSNSITY